MNDLQPARLQSCVQSVLSRRQMLARAALAAAGLAASPAWTAAGAGREDGTALFEPPAVWTVQLTVSAESCESLRKKPRDWVEADVSVDGRTYPRAGLHLKSTTSFLPLDKKASFTLSFNKNTAGQRFHGLRKIHLNNSVQDSSYVCEHVAGELFRKAGVPCARSAWARVRLNDRACPADRPGRLHHPWDGPDV